MTIDEVLDRYSKTNDPATRKKILDNIDDDLAKDPRIEKMKLWWNARYFYADKKKTRLGDNFVWIYLSANSNTGDKRSAKMFKEVYNKTIMSDSVQAAKKMDEDGFREQLIEAASIYVSSISTPRPVLGIFPQKDRSDDSKQLRVGRVILEEHMLPIWKYSSSYQDIQEIASCFIIAAERSSPGIKYTINDIIKESVDDPAFKEWLDIVLAKAKAN